MFKRFSNKLNVKSGTIKFKELINGIFECMLCDCLGHDIIQQQQQFTQPIICENQQCSNRTDLPAGSINIILSNEECEKYKPDGNILFSATLIFVPINQINLIKNDRMNNITGLKSIGIKTEVPTKTDLYDISNSNKLV